MNELFINPSFSIWFTVGVLILAIEILALNSYYLFWLGLAAIITSVIGLVSPSITIQLLFFAFTSVVSVVLTHRYKKTRVEPDNGLVSREKATIGRTATISESTLGGYHSIDIDGAKWRVDGVHDAGTLVRVVGNQSNILTVEPVES